MSAHFASAVPIPAIISRPLEPDLWRLTLLYRMITGGEDALYIARRLVVVASEDVGLADNHALPLVSLACEIGADGGNSEFFAGEQQRTRVVAHILGHGDLPSLSGDRSAGMPNQPRCGLISRRWSRLRSSVPTYSYSTASPTSPRRRNQLGRTRRTIA